MTAYLWSAGRVMYLDAPIDSPVAQISGLWFGRPVVYGPFMQERIMLVIKGRMPRNPEKHYVLTLGHSDTSPLAGTEPRPYAKDKEEALEGVREVEWERLLKSLEPKASP